MMIRDIISDTLIEFNSAFSLPTRYFPEGNIPTQEAELRSNLLKEELGEYGKASLMDKDIVEIADAVGDQLYVLLGTVVAHGLQNHIDDILIEIHNSNMSKLTSSGEVIKNATGKVQKSNQFTPPNIKLILEGKHKPKRKYRSTGTKFSESLSVVDQYIRAVNLPEEERFEEWTRELLSEELGFLEFSLYKLMLRFKWDGVRKYFSQFIKFSNEGDQRSITVRGKEFDFPTLDKIKKEQSDLINPSPKSVFVKNEKIDIMNDKELFGKVMMATEFIQTIKFDADTTLAWRKCQEAGFLLESIVPEGTEDPVSKYGVLDNEHDNVKKALKLLSELKDKLYFYSTNNDSIQLAGAYFCFVTAEGYLTIVDKNLERKKALDTEAVA